MVAGAKYVSRKDRAKAEAVTESAGSSPEKVQEVREAGGVEGVVEEGAKAKPDPSEEEEDESNEVASKEPDEVAEAAPLDRYLEGYVPGGLNPRGVNWLQEDTSGEPVSFDEMLTLADAFLRTKKVKVHFPHLSLVKQSTHASARICWKNNMAHVFASIKPMGIHFTSHRLQQLFKSTPRLQHFVFKTASERLAERKGVDA